MEVLKPGYKQTEVGVIPEEWEVLPFNALGTVIDGDRGVNYPSDQEFSESGHCLFLNAGNVTKDGFRFDECAFITREKDRKLSKGKLKRQDIVLTTRGTVGNFAYFDSSIPFDNLRINSGMVILRSDPSAIAPEFLYTLLQSHLVGVQIERLSFGSAQPQLTVKGISKLGIIVPSMAEQNVIAEVLSDVDALLGALDQLIAKKRDLKQAAMQQLLTGQTRLPSFDGEWEVNRLEEVADVKTGPFGSSLHESDYVRDGTPIITVEHLGEFGVEHINLPQVSNSDRQRLRAYSLELGDIVFSRVGSVDRNALIRAGEVGWLFSGRLLRVRPYKQKAFAPFLSYYFHGEAFIAAVRNMAVGQTMACLNTQILKGIRITLPRIPEQTAIAEVLSDIDAELAGLEQRREKTRALKQAMMQELLTGKTRLV